MYEPDKGTKTKVYPFSIRDPWYDGNQKEKHSFSFTTTIRNL